MGKAQIAMEYVAIVGIVFLVLSGTLYLFMSYARSSKEQMTETQLSVIAEDIINTAEELYYLGEASKKVIIIDMPQGINKFGLIVSASPPDESYLIFEIFSEVGVQGTKTVMFESNVKLGCDTSLPLINPKAGCRSTTSIHSQCGVNFDCYEFASKDYSGGIKHFKIETKNSGGYYVDIDEVSHELS